MLRLIPRHPRRTDCVSLQQGLAGLGYEINVRTIQRDLNKLSAVLPLISDQSKPQGWWWQADADVLDLPGLDPQSALVFKMAEQHLASVLPSATLDTLNPWFRAATGVLNQQGGQQRQWVKKIRIIPRGQPLLPPKVVPEVQEAVYRAVFENRRITIEYVLHRAPSPVQLDVNPIALIQRDHLIYVVCTLGVAENIRLLVLHRMRSARLSDTPSSVPEGFDLNDFIDQGGLGYPVGPKVTLEAQVAPAVASILSETPLSVDQRLDDGVHGLVKLTATVADTKEFRSWLRGFGRKIQVVSIKPAVASTENG